MESEYDKEFDEFLFETVGKDKLRMICMGLFINAYAPTIAKRIFCNRLLRFLFVFKSQFFKKS